MLVRYNALAAIDATGLHIAPASLLLHADRLHADDEAPESSRSASLAPHPSLPANTLHANLRLEALAKPDEIDAHLRELGTTPARTIKVVDAILTPALVNAHTHLDLTHIGPQPFDPAEGFTGFIRLVLSRRLTELHDINRSIAQGASLSLAGGVVAVGDIAGVVESKPSVWPLLALAGTPLHGVSFLEYFGIGESEEAGVHDSRAAIKEAASRHPANSRIRLGLQPHAPYTASPRLYVEASAHAHGAQRNGVYRMLASTHLAESPEERELITKSKGAFRQFLERVGWWNRAVEKGFVGSESPISFFFCNCSILGAMQVPFVLAHVNNCDDSDLRDLANSPHSIAYCPRSSSYFRNHEHFGPHRYRDMLAAGINVCLGTDSVINLPNGDRISTLDEARFLFARDGFDARELLAMATIRGARALGLPETAFRFSRGDTLAGLLAIPVESDSRNPWEAILRSTDGPRLIALHSEPL
jgi:cytosine/adenosine deaminase-related metal-dependent hydrolase